MQKLHHPLNRELVIRRVVLSISLLIAEIANAPDIIIPLLMVEARHHAVKAL